MGQLVTAFQANDFAALASAQILGEGGIAFPVSKRLSDRARDAALTIECNGTPIRGFASESLAAALFAADRSVVSRSLKYHRPRGMFCMDGHCGGGLMRVNGVPNIRTCMERCSEGARLETQNAYPSAERDPLRAVDFVFSKGMNHHTLMTGSKLTSPGGTAIVGLHTLEEGGLRTTLINAVEAATRRARELGDKG